jgi:hypothetical protein
LRRSGYNPRDCCVTECHTTAPGKTRRWSRATAGHFSVLGVIKPDDSFVEVEATVQVVPSVGDPLTPAQYLSYVDNSH